MKISTNSSKIKIQKALIGLFCLFSLLMTHQVRAQLSGTYTINPGNPASSTNYQNFTSAIGDMVSGTRTDGGTSNSGGTGGISGAVVFNVANGIYNEAITISAVSGSSATNTVTFQGASSDSSKVVLENSNSNILTISNAQYFTFKSITISALGQNDAVYASDAGSYHITLTNCIIHAGTGYTYAIYNYNPNNPNDHFLVNECAIHCGDGSHSYGNYSYGPSSGTQHTAFTNNIIDSFQYSGLNTFYEDSLVILGNTIKGSTNPSYSPVAMWLNNGIGTLNVSNNKIIIYGNGYGIYLTFNGYSVSGAATVYNNFVSMLGTNPYGAITDYDNSYINFDFNNCYFGNSGAYNAVSNDGSSSHDNFVDNNVVCTGNSNCFSFAGSSYDTVNYNNYFSPSGNVISYNYNPYNTLSVWQASGYGFDANSLSINPGFLSATDLRVSNDTLAGAGTAIPGISTDIFGTTRANPPTIGAVETIHCAPPRAYAGSNSILCSGVSASLGTAAVSGHTYSWVSNPAGFTSTISNPTVSPTVTTTYTLTETITATSCADSNSVVIIPNALSGSYTIGGTSPDYATFTDAVSALMIGICGPVTFNVRDGSYNEQILIGAIPGSSSTNTVTFQSSSNDSSKVNLNYSAASSSAADYVVKLNGASHVTFREITIMSNSGVYGIAVDVENLSQNNSFRNDYIAGTNTNNIYTSDPSISHADGSNCDSTVISNNVIKFGNAGINWNGATGLTTSSGEETGLVIDNNVIDSFAYNGVQLQYVESSHIIGNNISSSMPYFLTGIQMYSSSDAIIIAKNKITFNTGTYYGNGISLNYIFAESTPAYIGNNFISVNTIYDANGIYLNNSGGNIDIVFNNILDSSNYYDPGNAAAVWLYPTNTGNVLENNNIVAPNGALCIYDNDQGYGSSAMLLNFNNYYTGSSTNFGYYNNNPVSSLTGWQTATAQDVNSISVNPYYVSISNPTDSNKALAGRGINIPGINTDINGTTRAYHPTIGAVELTGCGAIAGQNQSVCSSAAIGIAADSGHTYSWVSNPSGFTSTLSNPSVSPTVVTTYILTETVIATSCSDTASVVVTPTGGPTAIATTTQRIDSGSSATIGNSAIGSFTYSWASSPYDTTLVPYINSSQATVSPTIATTYYVTVSNGTGCSVTDTSIVNVSEVSDSSYAGGYYHVCQYYNAYLGPSVGGESTYSWSSNPYDGNVASNSSAQNIYVYPSVTTTYYLQTTDANGNTHYDTAIVFVDTSLIHINPAITACSGGALQIGADSVSGYSYSWYLGPAYSSSPFSASPNPTVNPTTATTYSLVATSPLGCNYQYQVVYTPIKAHAGKNWTLCSIGDTVTIGTSPHSGASYSWTSRPSGFTSTTAQPTVQPSVETTYYLSEYDSSCSATTTDSAVIDIIPQAYGGPNKTICTLGDTVTLGGAPYDPNFFYEWNLYNGNNGDTLPSLKVSPRTITTYYLSVESRNAYDYYQSGNTQCYTSTSVVVTVPVAFAGYSQYLCSGSGYYGITLGGPAPDSGSTYSWTSKPSGFTSTLYDPTVYPGVNTTYYLTEISKVCNDTTRDSVSEIYNIPTYKESHQTLCTRGDSITIGHPSYFTDGRNADLIYFWYTSQGTYLRFGSNGSDESFNPVTKVSPTITTTYYLQGSTLNGDCAFNIDTVVVEVPIANIGGNKHICSPGASVQLGEPYDSLSSYSWTSSPGGFTSTLANPTVNPDYQTTYYLEEYNYICREVTYDTAIVYLDTALAHAGGNQTICTTGGSVTLGPQHPDTGYTYTWTRSYGIDSTYDYNDYQWVTNILYRNTANPVVSPTVSTIYYLTMTSKYNHSCFSRDSAVITVGVAHAGTSQTVCTGTSVQLGVPVRGDSLSFRWTSNPADYTLLQQYGSNDPTVTPTVTTTYYLTLYSAVCNDTTRDSVVLTLFNINAGGNKTTCAAGDTVTIGTPNNGGYYDWYINGVYSGITTAQMLVSPTVTTTYEMVEVSPGFTCSAEDTIIVNVLNAVAGANQSICPGTSTRIGTSDSNNSFHYYWTASTRPFYVFSNSSYPEVSPTITTTYFLQVFNNNFSCVQDDSTIITAKPAPVANAGGNQLSCGSVTLGVAPVSGDIYSWSSSPSGFSSTMADPSASPAVTTTYYLTVSNAGNSCVGTDNAVVQVSTANAGGNQTVCSGNSARLGVAPVPGSSYSWSSNPSGFSSTAAQPYVAPTVTTTYSVNVINSTCLSNTNDSAVVTVLTSTPSIYAGPNENICPGGSVVIGAAPLSGYAYAWSGSPGGFTSNSANPSVSPNVTTTYYLQASAPGGGSCPAIGQLTVYLPIADAGPNQTVCGSGSVTIGTPAYPGAGSTYSWSSNPSGFSSTVAQPSVSPAVQTTYTLQENTTCNGGSASFSSVVISKLIADAGGNHYYCSGASVTLGGASPNLAFNYIWSINRDFSTAFSSSPNPVVNPTVTTTYYLEVYNSVCVQTDSAIIIIRGANAGGNQEVCGLGGNVTIGEPAISGTSYSWSSNPVGFASTLANPTVSPAVETTYYLTEIDTVCSTTTHDSSVVGILTANAGGNKHICGAGSVKVGPPTTNSQYDYYWTANSPNGTVINDSANPTFSPTVTTTYYLHLFSAKYKCTVIDSAVITVGASFVVNAGGAKSICSGQSVQIGMPSDAGYTYSWAANPSGYTSATSNPTVSPTVTTTYYLTVSGPCVGSSPANSDSAVVTVLSPPIANAGGNHSICSGGSQQIGSTSVSGDTYSWTSNPSGYTSTQANPTVSPTVTTTYYLLVSNGACSATDSAVITIGGSIVANAGGNHSICNGSSQQIGIASVSGNAYTWSSNPSGYTSTQANPNVSPTITTTYYLTVTNGSCSGTDSAVITVNPLPLANAGSSSAICSGSTASIGSTAISGDTYSWASNPSGYSNASSNPSVSPTVTTTYTLTETITASGCQNSNSVVITVNPLPIANTGSSSAICAGSSASIGSTAISGDTYSWTSNPSGYSNTSSNPSVSPTVTTTYTLTETITATGCQNSNSIIITINPLPSANAGSSSAICSGSTASIGSTAISGDTYSWASNPSGYSNTSSNPSVSPTVTTTYTLTEIITATGCSKTDSVVITVNPLPVANAGGNHSICSGGSQQIGTASVSGNTYSWTSNPSGFTSAVANPNVSPTITTTYYLSVNNGSCSANDSAVITVGGSLSANAGGNHSICTGSSQQIGVTSVSGYAYSWTSNPSGFTSTSANPNVNPTITTTYYLTAAKGGCSGSDSAVITVNTLPTANAGSNRAICTGSSASIGNTVLSGHTYSWISNPSGYSSTSSNPSVSPTITTTYYLTETITATGCSKTDSVVITVNPLPLANAGSSNAVCTGSSASIGATAVSGDTYNWSSNPSGYASTASNASVSPTITTTYYLTERISTTGCSKPDSVVITINPLPAANAGSPQTICSGSPVSIGAASTGGYSYSWSSHPSGFSSTVSNPGVSPTITTTYYLSETINATGCSASDSVVVTPKQPADAGVVSINGSNPAICAGSDPVFVSITNFGTTALTSATINWTVGGISQAAYSWTGSLAGGSSASVDLGNFTFTLGSHKIKSWTTLPNGCTDANHANDTSSITISAVTGLHDTLTIGGSGASYATFSAAVSALTSKGMCGPVVFNVANGTYNEQINIPAITGSSAINTITFRSASGDSSKVILSFASSAANSNNYVVQLNGANYIIFNKITMQRTGAGNIASVANYLNGASNNTITHCRMIGVNAASMAVTRAVIYSAAGNDTGNIFSGNYIHNGSYGFYWKSAGAASFEGGNMIENNIIDSFYEMGVYVYGQVRGTVQANAVQNSANSGATGIYIDNCSSGIMVTDNKIYLKLGGYGIYDNKSAATAASPALLANNFVAMGDTIVTTGVSTGIYSYDAYYHNYYYNSVNIISRKSATTSRGIYMTRDASGAYGNVNVVDNIFTTTGGAEAIFVAAGNYPYLDTSDYNDLYTKGPDICTYQGTIFASLAKWQAATGKDAHSININPVFVSSVDLHTTDIRLRKAISLASVTTDIDGRIRSATSYIGADEPVVTTPDAGITSAYDGTGICKGTSSAVSVTLKSFNTNTMTSATINWQVNGVTQTPYNWTGSLGVMDSAKVNIGTDSFNTASTVIKVWTSNPNGSADPDPANDTATATIVTTMNGAYTIGGAGAGYATFTLAVDDLVSKGVCGPVVFNVANGTYNEQINIPAITGASGVNTITFRPASGDSSKVILSYASVTGGSNNYVVQLNGANYIIFKQITMQRTGANNLATVANYLNGASNNTITHCRVIGLNAASVAATRAVIYSDAGNDTGNVFSGNYIHNGSYGFYWKSAGAGSFEGGNIIENNTIDSFYSDGIYVYAQVRGTVQANMVQNSASTAATGIYTDNCSSGMLVTDNKIYLKLGGYGIYDNQSAATAASPALFSNNFIAMGDTTVTTGTSTGIYSYDAYYHNYYYNSVNIIVSKSATSGTGISMKRDATGTYGNVNVTDNIFTTTGGAEAIFVAPGNYPYLNTSNYNDLYTKGPYICDFRGTTLATLAKWQAATGLDSNSVNANPTFFSPTNLGTNSSYVKGKGISISGITVDIDGAIRPNPPSIGAYESNGTTFKTGGDHITLSAALEKNDVLLGWNAIAMDPDITYTVQRSLDQKLWDAISAPVPTQGEPGDMVKYTSSDNNADLLLSPVLFYRIMQNDNGWFTYSNVQEIAMAQPVEKNSVKIWYNREENLVYIQVTQSQAEEAAIRLVDMKGNIIKNIDASLGSGMTEIKLDMATYASGVYSCTVTGNAGTNTAKIVKY